MAKAVVHVLDDDDSVRNAFARLLKASGCEVRAYLSVEDFLQRDDAGPGDCFILDLSMTGARELAQQRAFQKERGPLPVIFVYGYGERAAGAEEMNVTAVAFLTKPVESSALIAAVIRALGSAPGRA